jgi:hypothetical protein
METGSRKFYQPRGLEKQSALKKMRELLVGTFGGTAINNQPL